LTDRELVVRKLAFLSKHLERARRRRAGDLDAYKASEDLQDALAMSLMVALQEAVDVAFHIAADEGWGVPGSNAEAFGLLGKHSVLSPELAAKMGTTVRLRNRLAHGYSTLDAERLWAELPEGLAVLTEFGATVSRWLDGASD
jgi:uncharacterized protein YutE (UPF0331/DUF86 family)